jgi:tetratricopeptide (TPR) repeat protein
LISSGLHRDGIAALERSIRLDPGRSAVRFNQIALALYFTGEYDAAVDAANRAIRSSPNYPNPYRWLAAALGQLGRIEEAKQALAKASELVQHPPGVAKAGEQRLAVVPGGGQPGIGAVFFARIAAGQPDGSRIRSGIAGSSRARFRMRPRFSSVRESGGK